MRENETQFLSAGSFSAWSQRLGCAKQGASSGSPTRTQYMGHLLLLFSAVINQLDWKGSGEGRNRHPRGMPLLQVIALFKH